MNPEQKVTAHKRRTRAEVQRLVAEFAKSGMQRSEFCRRHGLSSSVLDRHLKKLKGHKRKRMRRSASEVARLIPVELASSPSHSEAGCDLTVVLSAGRRIEVRRDFDVGTLERLLSVLEPA